ncbi:MAG: acetate--CoA ligase family protein [Candidatus Pacebacteria bacterium]|nr:acetate--CoA ligase family protein [Candidatus Paceibacterota bacterium]
MSQNKLEKFFSPKSVAVIGASTDKDKIGYGILKNIIEGKYKGKIYPVNLKAKKILGLKSYPSVSDIKEKVDLAIIVIPAPFVNVALRQCGEMEIKHVVIISAGFKEVGKEGAKLEAEMQAIAREFDIAVIGPNCLGLADSINNLNASFANGMTRKGTLGFISQSGAICSAMLDWANVSGVGFSRFISFGNKVSVGEAELLEYFKDDKETTAVLAYLESFKDGEKFMKAAAELAKTKPLIIIKPGTSKASQKAMQSHTGALAGADEATRVVFSQTGATRVNDMQELFGVANFLSRYEGIKNNRIAIITNAGGPGVLASDEIESYGLQLAKLSKKTSEFLKANLPAEANIHNPVDVLGDAKADRFRIALDVLLDDKNVDGIVFILTPQRGTEIAKTAKVLTDAAKRTDKPIVASFIGGELINDTAEKLKKSPVAAYDHLSAAICALGKIWECEKNKTEAKEYLTSCHVSAIKNHSNKEVVALKQNPDFIEALKLLEEYGIDSARSEIAKNKDEAVQIAKEIGYPVAIKIFSRKISHKTEVEGVKIDICSDLEVSEYFDRIKGKLGGDFEGIIIQPMVDGREIILGVKGDENFGHLLMFGLGGIYTEVVKDVAFRFAPIDREEAMEMMQEIKSFKILTGYRQFPKMDIEALADTLVGLSNLVVNHPEIKELDINPLMVQKEGQGCKAVDVRIMIK